MGALIDRRLLGEWRSDKALTLAEWIFSDSGDIASRASLASTFGRLVTRYSEVSAYTEFEGSRTACPYRVVAMDRDLVTSVCLSEEHDEIRHLRFIGSEIYWVSVGRNREYFRRLT